MAGTARLSGLLFGCAAGVHAKNAVRGAHAEQSCGKRNYTDPGPCRTAHERPDNQGQTYDNSDNPVSAAYIWCHVVLRRLINEFAMDWLTCQTVGFNSIVRQLVFLASLMTPLAALAADGKDFLAAREAWASGNIKRFAVVAEKIPRESPLHVYIAFWKVSRELDNDEAIASFLANYPDAWLAERLRADWLKNLGRRERWQAYLAEYPRLVKPEVAHECLARRAELTADNRSRLKDAITLWFTGRDMPAVCTPLFATLIAQGLLNEEDVWRRLRLAFEAGNPGVAKSLLSAIPEQRRPSSTSIDRAYQSPSAWLESGVNWEIRSQREVGFFALSRLAKSDPVSAARYLESALGSLVEADQRHVWGVVANEAARQHLPQALTWYEKTGGIGLSDARREWWVRAALRAENWQAVQRAIRGMSEETRQVSAWRYWLARALKATGQNLAANQIFAPLSREHHYYGQLAEEELGPVMGVQSANIKMAGDEIDAVSRDPGITRALKLNEIGLRTEATQEWNWAIRSFSDRQLLAAAELARRNAWHDRAINTAEKTRDLHDFELRFVAPYREFASREARANNLDEAWVFGLIRQESRFMPVARSSVGATGLMQIMPATGRWIAQRLGLDGYRHSSLDEPETNIRFGTYYLRYTLDVLDKQPVLATAAYNAGPRRAQRWRDSQPMEAAIYIESIPFAETRDYVRKVMSNAMYYARRFGQPSVLLKDRLGTIPARTTPAPLRDEKDAQPNLEASG